MTTVKEHEDKCFNSLCFRDAARTAPTPAERRKFFAEAKKMEDKADGDYSKPPLAGLSS